MVSFLLIVLCMQERHALVQALFLVLMMESFPKWTQAEGSPKPYREEKYIAE